MSSTEKNRANRPVLPGRPDNTHPHRLYCGVSSGSFSESCGPVPGSQCSECLGLTREGVPECFEGHAMVLTQGGKGRWDCSAAIDCDAGFQADSDRYICSSCGLTLCIGCLPSWRQYVQLVSAYRLGYYDMMKRLAAECEAPMYGACLSGRLDVVNHLVQEVNVDLETVTKKGRTAFSASCRVGCIDVVRYLREVAGVDIERAASDGATPFNASCHQGHMDVVRYLVFELLFLPNIFIQFNCNSFFGFQVIPCSVYYMIFPSVYFFNYFPEENRTCCFD